MSTRANIIIKDKYNKLYFYRHSDGYPEGTMPLLNKFLDWVKTGEIRDSVTQSSGWLILLGAIEYATIPKHDNCFKDGFDGIEDPSDWKCGAIEPTTTIHGDITYLYVIDLVKKEIKTERK